MTATGAEKAVCGEQISAKAFCRPPLSAKEQEILALIGHGLTTKEIAAATTLSPQTVATHRRTLCRKLDLHSTAALVACAAGLRKHE